MQQAKHFSEENYLVAVEILSFITVAASFETSTAATSYKYIHQTPNIYLTSAGTNS